MASIQYPVMGMIGINWINRFGFSIDSISTSKSTASRRHVTNAHE
jgi:hypothetical protein